MSTPAKLKLAVAALALSASGLASLKVYEGSVRNDQGQHVAYLDTGNVPTVCYGHTQTARMGQVRSDAICERLLASDVAWAEAAVRSRVNVPLTQDQYDALVSFTFNLGEANLRTSTLLRLLNAGDCLGAAKQFDRWVYDDGIKRAGLVTRRAHERSKFEPGCTK